MPNYKIVLNVPGSKLPTVESRAQSVFGAEVVLVKKVDLSKSRAQRLADIAAQIEDCMSDVDELKEELEEWRDNLPESLQGGSKSEELEETIQALEEIKDSLEGVDFTSVSFPSMMG